MSPTNQPTKAPTAFQHRVFEALTHVPRGKMTTYSAIAMLDHDGNPIVLNNADGRPITPSVVLLDEDRVVVGPTFERIAVADPKSIVEAIKREMGNKNFFVVYQNKKLTPEFLSALILKKI